MIEYRFLNPTAVCVLLGGISMLPDIYTENHGNIFSQMAVWIPPGTLLTYHAAAVLTDGVYNEVMIIGWTGV